MQELFRRSCVLNELVSILRNNIKIYGNKLLGGLNNSNSDANKYVEDLIKMREKYFAFINKSFKKDPMILRIIINSFEDFINTNSKTALALSI